jgi:hypothetical protein
MFLIALTAKPPGVKSHQHQLRFSHAALCTIVWRVGESRNGESMDILVTTISSIVYLILSIITVFVGISDEMLIARKKRLIIFLLLSIIYCGSMIYEKNLSANREMALHNETNYRLMHLGLASLDLSTPTKYQEYPNFRLGLMWYWLGSLDEAAYHFKGQLKKDPKHIPSMYNLGIVLVLQHNEIEAISKFSSIPKQSLSPNKKNLVDMWLRTLSTDKSFGFLRVGDSKQWEMWKLP